MPMDFEAWKEFMAEQQAQFWADLRAMEARQAETARLADENRQRIATLVDVCMSLATNAQETDRRLRELGEETDRRIRELREGQAHTDDRLDALINAADASDRRLSSFREETDRRLREIGEETGRHFRELGEETDRRIRELRDAQAHSDRRLDALINVVDVLVKRNGKHD